MYIGEYIFLSVIYKSFLSFLYTIHSFINHVAFIDLFFPAYLCLI